MNQQKLERTAKPSVLDRLIDYQPRESSDAPKTRETSEREFRGAVLRDLEWLLNTRRSIVEVPDGCVEVGASVFNFGLPDLSSLPAGEAATRARLTRQIEEAIATFEPRLTNVRVSVAGASESDRLIRFTIEGMLNMEPDPERVVFDTILELSSGEISVNG